MMKGANCCVVLCGLGDVVGHHMRRTEAVRLVICHPPVPGNQTIMCFLSREAAY